MKFSIIFVIAIVAMIGMSLPSIFAQSGMDDILEKRIVPAKQMCVGSQAKIFDTCDYKCGKSEINFTINDDDGNFIKKGSFENVLHISLDEYPENSVISLSKDTFQDNEIILCKLDIVDHDITAPNPDSYIVDHDITAPNPDSYNYEETNSNVEKTYTYAEIYATADNARLDCNNKYSANQFAYNECMNNVNSWELNELDRTDYYGEPQRETSGGGCLIATATYGSELAPQVQQLRELRDNQLLQTESGAAFMSTFNDVYYSFSPIIADYERENPLFKEAVKLAITPMISTLSLMENAESESEVLSIGLSVIMLNLGMYLGIPAIVIIGIRRNF